MKQDVRALEIEVEDPVIMLTQIVSLGTLLICRKGLTR